MIKNIFITTTKNIYIYQKLKLNIHFQILKIAGVISEEIEKDFKKTLARMKEIHPENLYF
jgi:hypothetical protein